MAVVIAGYYGFGNAGDELILRSLIQNIRRENPQETVTVFSKHPVATARSFQTQAVDRWRPWTWWTPLLEAERFVLGGGGLLQETTGGGNHFYYLSLLVLAKIFGCRTEAVALGVDPIQKPFNRFWTRFVLNHWTDALSVRDELSRQALIDAGVSYPIEIQTDPVFDLKMEPSNQTPHGIALVLSLWKGRPQWVQEATALCDELTRRLRVPIDLIVLFPEEDAALAQAVARDAAGIRSVRLWDSPEDLLSWMTQYELVVSMRFHALVLASLSCTPFVGWGTQKKVASLCRKLEMPYWNSDEGWDLERRAAQIAGFYETKFKSVILENRIG